MIDILLGSIALTFVNSIGPRVVQRLIPTKFEEAQIASVALQRERMEQEERRFEQRLVEDRQRFLAEHQSRLELTEWQHQLARWPMGCLPADFIRRSADAHGRALNVIVRQTDHRPQKKETKNDATLLLLKDAIFKAEGRMLEWYPLTDQSFSALSQRANGVLFYPDYRVHRDSAVKGVQEVVTTLSNSLSTEPTVLIDLAVTSDLICRVTVAHWGEVYNSQAHAIALPSFLIDLSTLESEVGKASFYLSLSLSSIIASMADTFHLLRSPHAFPTPELPQLMAWSANAKLPGSFWKPLTQAYQAAIGHVAENAPALASELSAGAALVTHSAQQQQFADELLNDAIRYYRAATRFSGDEQAIMNRLTAARARRDEPLKLQSALDELRGLGAIEANTTQASSSRTIEDLFRNMGQAASPTK
jgi:hypothetical protein